MKKITITMAALAVAGVAQMASGQITPPDPVGPAGLYLENGGPAIFVPLTGGMASFSGPVGSYGVTAVFGSGSGTTSPFMDMNINITSAGTGNLYVFFTDGAFGPTSGGSYSLFTSQFNQLSTGATISTWAYQNATQLGGSPDSPTGAVVNSTGPLNGSSYYLTIEDVINGSVNSADTTFVSSVPEANTLVAGALMLLPLGIGAVRAIRKERVA